MKYNKNMLYSLAKIIEYYYVFINMKLYHSHVKISADFLERRFPQEKISSSRDDQRFS